VIRRNEGVNNTFRDYLNTEIVHELLQKMPRVKEYWTKQQLSVKKYIMVITSENEERLFINGYRANGSLMRWSLVEITEV
jgi:hypothetical protein